MDDEFQTARVAQEQQLTVLEKANMRSRISIRQHIQGIEHAFEEAGASIGSELDEDPETHNDNGKGGGRIRGTARNRWSGVETEQWQRQTRQREFELAATDKLVLSALQNEEQPARTALEDFTTEQKTMWDTFEHDMRVGMEAMESSLHAHRTNIGRSSGNDLVAQISQFRRQLRASAGNTKDTMRSLKRVASEVGRLAKNAENVLNSPPGPSLQITTKLRPAPNTSTPTPTEPRERETSTVDDGIGTKSAPALHMQTPREIVDLDGTNRSWVRVFKAVKADNARREKQRAENKAIADAYFAPRVPPPIGFVAPPLNRPVAEAEAEVPVAKAGAEVEPKTPTPTTPEAKKDDSTPEPTKEEKRMSDFAALLQETVRATVSAIAPAVKSPPSASETQSTAALAQTTKLISDMAQTIQQSQRQQQQFFVKLLKQAQRQQQPRQIPPQQLRQQSRQQITRKQPQQQLRQQTRQQARPQPKQQLRQQLRQQLSKLQQPRVRVRVEQKARPQPRQQPNTSSQSKQRPQQPKIARPQPRQQPNTSSQSKQRPQQPKVARPQPSQSKQRLVSQPRSSPGTSFGTSSRFSKPNEYKWHTKRNMVW